MPSEFSVYRKIQLVLDVANSVEVDTIAELRDEIEGLKPDNFLTRHYDPDRDKFVAGISERSIRHTVDFCQRLHLIDESGGLTKAGRQALNKTQFEKVVATQIRAFLKREGFSFDAFNKIITKNLRRDPPILTTCKELWEEIGDDTSYSVFSRMLSLLAQCGGAQSSQKKIYLHIGED